MKNLILDGNSLTIEDVYRTSTDTAHISFSQQAKRRVRDSRHVIDEWLRHDEVIYGVTTGFGEFSNVRISRDNIERLQENLIMSHAAGAGDPLPAEVARAMMILRMNALVKGYSGIRLETVDFLRTVFNAGIVPMIPSRGSVVPITVRTTGGQSTGRNRDLRPRPEQYLADSCRRLRLGRNFCGGHLVSHHGHYPCVECGGGRSFHRVRSEREAP